MSGQRRRDGAVAVRSHFRRPHLVRHRRRQANDLDDPRGHRSSQSHRVAGVSRVAFDTEAARRRTSSTAPSSARDSIRWRRNCASVRCPTMQDADADELSALDILEAQRRFAADADNRGHSTWHPALVGAAARLLDDWLADTGQQDAAAQFASLQVTSPHGSDGDVETLGEIVSVERRIAAERRFPPRGQRRAQPDRYSGKAIAAMCCGICGFITWGVSGIVGIALAVAARDETRSGQRLGEGMRKAGLVCGIVSASLVALIIAFAIATP